MRVMALWLGLIAVAGASNRQETFEFAARDFETSARDGWSLVTGSDLNVTDEPGRPQLPAKPVAIALPGLGRVSKVNVTAADWRELQTGIVPFPAQPQVILSRLDSVAGLTAPDPAVYGSASPWPPAAWRWTGTGRQNGRTLVELVLYPVRYTGAGQKLEYCPRFSVDVEYEPQPAEPRLDQHAFEYVIVTSSEFDSIFARLAAWKTQKGVPAVVRHIDWVYATYPGRDNAERLRNYLKTLPDSGVRWVLLGGDVSVVPFRKAFAMVSEAHYHSREDSLPCDLYFADLDGTWDRDGDNVFGEIADSIDLYADLCVGRAPVDTRSEAQGFVNKVLQYEAAAIPRRQSNALFFAMVLWSDPYTDGGRHKDKLEARSFSAGYSVNKLYERLGNLSRTAVMSALRSGQNFSNHDGHGWIDVMSCGYTSLGTRDGDTITNAYRGVLYSIGCWTTAFDFTSIGEAFVANPNGGTVATIGHSSYGWGSPGNPGFGYSDRYDDRFWYEVLNQGNTSAGAALAGAKTWFVPFSREANVYRWHQYETNLMGDPEMPVWTRAPESLDIAAPAEIPVGPARVLVTVTRAGAPVVNALVCLMKGSESYGSARTNVAGQAWLAADPGTAGDFTLTVTAVNYLPYAATIPVSSGAHVNFAGWAVNDSLGNNDHVPNPSELLFLTTTMHNAGDSASAPALLILRTAESEVALLDSMENLSALAPGESLQLANAFRVSLDSFPHDGQLLRFELVETGTGRRFGPALLVGRPALEVERYCWIQPPAMPGQTEDLRVACENRGLGWGHGVVCRLNSLDPYVTVLAPDSIVVGEIGPKTRCVPLDSFRVAVAGGCPGTYLAPVEFVLSCEDRLFRDTLRLLIGEYGFYDNMENGETQWTHGGTGDRWHRSTTRRHSGEYSWYCGDEGSHRYVDNMNTWLRTMPFMVAEHCSLRFWRWFSVPNYGVDGIYVVAEHDAQAETLDFIGTGGALPGAARRITESLRSQKSPNAPSASLLRPFCASVDGIVSDWFEESYDLSWMPVGDTVQVRIGFKSDDDGDRGEGFYIDDFTVTGGSGAVVALADEPVATRPMQLAVGPSPFRDQVGLCLTGVRDRQVTAAIYDATGRTVRNARLQTRNGRVTWTWEGSDDAGIRLSAGVYIIRFRSADRAVAAQVVLQR